jgi:hypothetical protein
VATRIFVVAIIVSTLAVLPAFAAEGFGIAPGSFTAGSYGSDGAGALGEGATPDSQAGDHPYQATVTFALNATTDASAGVVPVGYAKDVAVQLPPGFVGDPNATPHCSQPILIQTSFCPNDTVIGVAHVRIVVGIARDMFLPVYNMSPSGGQLALFAFHIPNPSENVFIHVHVRAAGDYGVTATITDIPQSGPLLLSTLTLWGVPPDPSHDPFRGSFVPETRSPGTGCLIMETGASRGTCPSDTPPRALLTNPTLCDGRSLSTTLALDSWESPGPLQASGPPDLSDPAWQTGQAASPALAGCERLAFDPSLRLTSETTRVDTPTGYELDLRVPQTDSPHGLATPELRHATVTLPAGVAISPAAADGLQGCTPEQIALHSEAAVSCPDASKLATVTVSSPALPRGADGAEGTLGGFLYLGQAPAGPISGPPYMVYLTVAGYGLTVKLAGQVVPNPATGQLTTTFAENPPLPFDDLRLAFFGGPRAALSNPPACGSYTTASQLTPFSSAVAATPSSSFTTSWDGAGAPCPSPMPFGPSFAGGTTGTSAGAFTTFALNVSRVDGQQLLSGISLTTPPGLLGMLSHVQLCREPQAAQGTCPAVSRIGTVTAAAGSGPDPLHVSGLVYLTGRYRGAPFGLSVVVPAVAGPFNLGNVIVRSAIAVDPHTAQLTVSSDPLPQMVGESGVPVRLRSVSVAIDRPGFIFNPTSCAPLSVNGTLVSNRGAAVPVSSPFQLGGCRALAFHPSFSASTSARSSKAYGASLDVRVASTPGQANIAKVDVQLPPTLPARLSTLQQACSAAQFDTNPAGCPAASVVGIATAHTPVLNAPLTGPVYLVSHGGAAFPDLIVVLQGEGITVELVGATDIKHGLTYSRFETLPDAPVDSFELELPQSPHSALGAFASLCGHRLLMPTAITAQNGAQLKQTTTIAVTGCHRARSRPGRPTGRRPRHGMPHRA